MKILWSLVPYSLLAMPITGWSQCQESWNTGNANWDEQTSWTGTCIPGANGINNDDFASFGTSGITATLQNNSPTPFTANLENLFINENTTIVSTGANSGLQFNRSTAGNTLLSVQGINVTGTINSPINLVSSPFQVFTLNDTTTLTINQPISDSGTTSLFFDNVGGFSNTGTFTHTAPGTGGNHSSINGDFTINDVAGDSGTFNNLNTFSTAVTGDDVSFSAGGELHLVAGQFIVENDGDLSNLAANGSTFNAATLVVDGGMHQVLNKGDVGTNTGTVGSLLSVDSSTFNGGSLDVHNQGQIAAGANNNIGALFFNSNTITLNSGTINLKNEGAVITGTSSGSQLSTGVLNMLGGTITSTNSAGQITGIGCSIFPNFSLNMSGSSNFSNLNDIGANVQTNGIGVVLNLSNFGATLSENSILSFTNKQPIGSAGAGAVLEINDILTLNDQATFSALNQGDLTNNAIGFSGNVNSLTMNNGTFTLTNEGTLNQSRGVIFNVSSTDINMNGGALTLANTGTSITNGSAAVSLFGSARFEQTGGVVQVLASPLGSIEAGSVGSSLSFNGNIDLSGTAILENDEIVATPSTITVNPGATVKGTGTFAGDVSLTANTTFVNNGTVIPGAPLGIMRILGPYVQGPQGELIITILNASAPGAGYTQLNVTGTAMLDGTLAVQAEPGFVINTTDTFTILQSTDPRTGTFAQVVNLNIPGLTPVVTYFPNSVLLSFLQSSVANPCCCPKLCSYMGDFPQTILASVTGINNSILKREFQRIQQRNLDKGKGTYYVGPIGSVGHSHSHGDTIGYNYWSAGALAGADYACSKGGLGGLVTYERIDGDGREDWGNFDVDHAHASLYGTAVSGSHREISLDAALGGGYEWYRIKRHALSGTAKGSPNGWEFDGFLSLEYMLSNKQFTKWNDKVHFTPMVNVQYIYTHVDGYSEDDAGFNDIKFESQKVKSFSTILGAFADYTWKIKERDLMATVDLAWQHEYLNHERSLHYATETNSGLRLDIGGAKRNTLLAGIDFLLGVCEKGSLEAAYDLQWNSRFTSNRFYLGYNSQF